MRNRIKIQTLIVCIILLVGWTIGKIIVNRDPTPNNFPLRQTWKTQLSGNIYGISIAENETILVRTSTTLYALSPQNGKVIWQYSLSWQADAKPAIAKNGKVYVTDGNSVLALDQKNGAFLWKQMTSYSSLWITDVSESVIIVNQLGIDIIVFDANSGEFLWRKPVCRGYVKAFTSGENIYIPCDGLKVIGIKSGEISWTADIGVIDNIDHSQDVVYFFVDSVRAYDLNDQKTLWNTTVVNTGFERIKIINNTLFYTDDVRLCILDVKNGHLKWCSKTKYPQSPVIIDNYVYIFDGSHKTITAYQIVDGKKIGELSLSNFNYFIVDRQLLASNGNLLLFANGNKIYAYTK